MEWLRNQAIFHESERKSPQQDKRNKQGGNMLPQFRGRDSQGKSAANFDAVKEWIEPIEELHPLRKIANRKIETAKQKEGHDNQGNIKIQLVDILDHPGVGHG